MAVDADIYQETNATASSIARRLKDLRNYQLSRLRDCRDAAVQGDIAGEMREDLETTLDSIDSLTELAYEQDNPADREGFLARAEAFGQEADDIRQLYRKALLFSAAEIKKANRISVLQSRPAVVEDVTRPEERRDDDDPLQAKTNEVTDALRRTVGTMKAELERSVQVTQMFDESTQTLRSTSSLYDRSSNLLKSSAHMVKQLEKADWYDRMVIFLALGFFFLVVGFIVKRRVLDKLVGGVSWWVGGTFRILTGRTKRKMNKKLVTSGMSLITQATGKAIKAAKTVTSALSSQASETLSTLSSDLSGMAGSSTSTHTITAAETSIFTTTTVASRARIEL